MDGDEMEGSCFEDDEDVCHAMAKAYRSCPGLGTVRGLPTDRLKAASAEGAGDGGEAAKDVGLNDTRDLDSMLEDMASTVRTGKLMEDGSIVWLDTVGAGAGQ